MKYGADVRISEKLLLTAKEASALSGLSLDVIRLEIIKGNINYITMGKGNKVMVERATLEKAVAEMAKKKMKLSPATAGEERKALKG